jgi:uncharacterized BrkB/YihY/UPF0761 family membrane protein
MNFNFWQKWLLISGILVSVFGVIMVLNLTAEVFDPQFDPVFWDEETPGIQVKNYQQWIIGVLGSVMVSWGIFIAFLAAIPFKRKEKWSRNCLLAGILSWYIVDTIISLKAHVGLNALQNTVLAIILLLPICFTFNKFKEIPS